MRPDATKLRSRPLLCPEIEIRISSGVQFESQVLLRSLKNKFSSLRKWQEVSIELVVISRNVLLGVGDFDYHVFRILPVQCHK